MMIFFVFFCIVALPYGLRITQKAEMNEGIVFEHKEKILKILPYQRNPLTKVATKV